MDDRFSRRDRYLHLLKHANLKPPRPISSGDIVLFALILTGLWGSVANDYVFLAALNTLLLICWLLNVSARRYVSSCLIRHAKDVDKIKAIISAPGMVQDGENTVITSMWPSDELIARVGAMNALLDKVHSDRIKAAK